MRDHDSNVPSAELRTFHEIKNWMKSNRPEAAASRTRNWSKLVKNPRRSSLLETLKPSGTNNHDMVKLTEILMCDMNIN